jgi:hypothetical protein
MNRDPVLRRLIPSCEFRVQDAMNITAIMAFDKVRHVMRLSARVLSNSRQILMKGDLQEKHIGDA